ncbi:2-polyprenyl-6-methoxyphenol hydroxylase-like FAD-dependent oxidoreductase [Actinocorallia herbida]|uniref:2-polyprenyl-6-methoxyphenol hydroxylase-like FAD-dependent oxidoreductase n=1 Tax=Actinocorallia herbida TaxID=58109 RepID=A0A3N1D2A3_9ACTN|nr:FAD-dependent monooxygenase [Actinocorallia herbida]ROO87616.1 2-polyprenyl-6-methoxyphenol hydroxylase-like FAD-dependent oxidoreductase [Actinocorallia herbida]
MPNARVLIVGAGIGGLATAIALADAGHEATVIEIQPTLHSSVYGVGIIQAPNQLRALDAIGCARQCIEQGYPAEFMNRMYDMDGNLVSTIPGPKIPGFDFPAMNGITRPRLHAILTDRARAVGASIEYDKTITEIKQFHDRAEVGLTDGTTRTVDLVVGADGVRSVVRGHVFDAPQEPRYTGKSVLRINIPRLPEMDAIVRQEGRNERGERIGVGMVPLAEDLGYLFVNIVWDRAVRPSGDELRAILKRELAGFGGPSGVVRDHYVDTGAEIVLRPEEWLLAPAPWHKGRVVLIGDAAHAVTPNTAQGAAQAIEDGIVLTECLGGGLPLEQALTAYTRRRYERCKLVVDYGYKARQWEFDPTPDFDPQEMGIRMRQSLIEPI